MNIPSVKIFYFANTSAQKICSNINFPLFALPSHKTKDVKIVLSELADSKTDYVFCFGQKPLIKNKICLETRAISNGQILESNINLKELTKLFCNSGINAVESSNPGTSYCNNIYWHSLEYIQANKEKCKCVFIHVPFEKNIDDIRFYAKTIEKVIVDFVLL